MNSMTGFGRATQIVDGLQCIIEIKSVNSRFLDLNIRSPKQVNSVEHSIRKCIQKTIHRGKVDVFVTLQDVADREKQFIINSSYSFFIIIVMNTNDNINFIISL